LKKTNVSDVSSLASGLAGKASSRYSVQPRTRLIGDDSPDKTLDDDALPDFLDRVIYGKQFFDQNWLGRHPVQIY
jgi:hypothetical protein